MAIRELVGISQQIEQDCLITHHVHEQYLRNIAHYIDCNIIVPHFCLAAKYVDQVVNHSMEIHTLEVHLEFPLG